LPLVPSEEHGEEANAGQHTIWKDQTQSAADVNGVRCPEGPVEQAGADAEESTNADVPLVHHGRPQRVQWRPAFLVEYVDWPEVVASP